MHLYGWRGLYEYTCRHMYTRLGPPPSKRIFGVSNPIWKPIWHSWTKTVVSSFLFGLGHSRFKAKKNDFLSSQYFTDGVHFYLVESKIKLSNKEKRDIYISIFDYQVCTSPEPHQNCTGVFVLLKCPLNWCTFSAKWWKLFESKRAGFCVYVHVWFFFLSVARGVEVRAKYVLKIYFINNQGVMNGSQKTAFDK